MSAVLALDLEEIGTRLPRPAESARHRIVERRAIALTVHGRGAGGAAEAAPLAGFSEETLDETLRALRGASVREGAPLEGAARALSGGPPSARFGLEAALLDRAGKLEARPAAALLGASRLCIRNVALLGSLETALADAASVIEAGAAGVKVKIGRPGRARDEAEVLRALRLALGESTVIRADANGALGGASHTLLGVLAEIGADYVEEPFAVERVLEGGSLVCPVALDESVDRAPEACLEAVARGRVAALVLKPTRLGIARTLALAEETKRRGGRVVVGHLFEPPRAFAALAHVAAAVAPEERHGLAPYPGLDGWTRAGGVAVEVPAFLRGPALSLEGSEGLG